MKKLLFLLLLTSAICFGQKTYIVTEGELAFIHPEEGIIVHKKNAYINLEIDGDIDGGRMTFETSALPLSQETIDRLKQNPENIYPEDLGSVNIRQLKKIRFNTVVRDEVNTISLLNNESFIDAQYSPDGIFHSADQIPYFYIKFSNKKIIHLTEKEESFIIRSKKGISLYKNLKKYKTENAITALSLHDLENIQFGRYFEDYYRVDTIGKKVGLRNYFNEQILPAKYDSIVASPDFLTAYTNKKTELYNPILKHLKFRKLRAVKQTDKFPLAHIIEGNKQKKINILGLEDYKDRVWIGYGSSHDGSFAAIISKEANIFYIYSPGIELFTDRLVWGGERRELYNTKNLDSIYLWKNEIKTNFFGGIASAVCICKMDDGKYKLEHLTNFFYEHPETLPEEYARQTILTNLDFAEDHYGYIKFVKNGLIGYYPYNKTARYKEIDEYRGFENFIRFTLPNGRKGWLDTNGKEYLDE